MKNTLFLILALGAFTVIFAQAKADTVFYTDQTGHIYMSIQQGQTPGEAHPVAINTAQQSPVVVAPLYADSVQIYQNLIDQQSTKGQSLRHAGTALFWSGIGFVAIGSLLFLENVDGCNDDDDYYDDNDDKGSCSAQWAGLIGAELGTAGMVTGIILKGIGNKKLSNAEQYRYRLNVYQWRKQQQAHQFSLRLSPTVNPVQGSAGAKLSLLF
jgi:hypothetical protein